MNHSTAKCFALLLACIALLVCPAAAVEIELFDTGAAAMSAAQMAAFRAAADRWETLLVDPITVRVNVALEQTGSAALGDTRVQRTTHAYESVREALLLDANSTPEVERVTALPHGALPLTDIQGQRTDAQLTLSTANAKALGLGTGLDPLYGGALANQADAQIRFNSKFAGDFDLDPADGVDRNKIDFVTLATREIGHALGFQSMVDVSDLVGNRRATIHPSALDIWRFPIASLDHNLTTEPRLLTAGPAEFFTPDQEREMSWGRLAIDPLCDGESGRCLASYWRDPYPDTFTPTLEKGETLTISAADLRALDAVGYQRASRFDPREPRPIQNMVVGWFEPSAEAPCLGCAVPEFAGGEFDHFAAPPAFRELPPELRGADFNLGVRIGLDLGVDGMRNRSGLGFATFRDAIVNPAPFTVAPGDEVAGEQTLLPPAPPPTNLPPAITDFYFRSDETAGAPFTFIAELGADGAPFDPTIGEFGGYRISGFLDGAADGVIGDNDGLLTFLLAVDKSGNPDGPGMNLYQFIAAADSSLFDADEFAFEFGTFVPGDTYPFDGKVDLYDLNNVRNHFGESGEFGTPGDTPRFDGKVDLSDLNAVRNNFGYGVEGANAVPEPSSLALAVASLALVAVFSKSRR